jgi:hypothetical protein
VKQHKIDSKCEGKRKRTEFIPKEQMDDQILISDLKFLVDGMNEVERIKRVAISIEEERDSQAAAGLQGKRSKRKLISEAKNHGCKLVLMPDTMTKHSRNSSRYDAKSGTIMWRVEWYKSKELIQAQSAVSENTIVDSLFPKELKNDSTQTVFLEQHNLENFHVEDTKATLRSLLEGKTIVEFPTFRVVERASEVNNLS